MKNVTICASETLEDFDDLIINHDFFVGGKNELKKCLNSYGKKGREPRCTSILGPSGSGKSTLIHSFAEEYIPTLSSAGWERPILIVETPSNPTTKTMASEVLREQGDPSYSRGTEVQMMTRIINLLEEQKTRMIIFDEMQSLIDRDSAKLNHKVADLLKRLINLAKVPTVIVGLEQTEKLFQSNEQLKRRFREAFIMYPFEWENMKTRKVLRGFLGAIQENLRLDEGLNFSSPEMAYRFYCATGGLVGYIMAIVREASELASECRQPIITIDHLAKAYSAVVCGNRNLRVNPFANLSESDIQIALKAVEPSAITKSGV